MTDWAMAVRPVNPLVVRMCGATVDWMARATLEAAGFAIAREDDLWLDVKKLLAVRSSE
jgi:hypothetical protein